MRKFGILGVISAIFTAVMLTAIDPVIGDPPHAHDQKAPHTKRITDPTKVPQYLQDISVTIFARGQGFGASGSGVFKVTKDGQVWVWTCGHLVEVTRQVRKDDTGKNHVEFGDVKIIKVLTEEGRKVGELTFDAEVIRYSDAEHGEDLALLRLRSKQFKPAQSVEFYLDKEIPQIGTRLLHCGSLLGQLGSNSVTNGIVSQLGRVLFNNKVFDQTNAASFPGSSGGIECLENDGRYVGMLTRGAGETFSLYVPVRRMRDWAKKVKVEFAMDDDVAVPSDDELYKIPVDDATPVPASKDKAPASPHARMFPTREQRFDLAADERITATILERLFKR